MRNKYILLLLFLYRFFDYVESRGNSCIARIDTKAKRYNNSDSSREVQDKMKNWSNWKYNSKELRLILLHNEERTRESEIRFDEQQWMKALGKGLERKWDNQSRVLDKGRLVGCFSSSGITMLRISSIRCDFKQWTWNESLKYGCKPLQVSSMSLRSVQFPLIEWKHLFRKG